MGFVASVLALKTHDLKANAYSELQMAGKHTEIQIPTANLPRDEDQRRRKLLRHSDALQIIAAWVITVPATAVLSSVLFVVLRAVLV